MNYRLTTDKTWHATLQDMAETFRKWKAVSTWRVTPNPRGAAEYRKLERQNQSESERTVLLEYVLHGTPVQLTMNKQSRAVDNQRVLYLAVEDMRLIEARGISDVVRAAYLQLAAPAPAAMTNQDAYAVLGVSPSQSLTEIERRYRQLAAQFHPDKPSGDLAQFQAITAAIAHIRSEKGTAQ